MTAESSRVAVLVVAFRNTADVRGCLISLGGADPTPPFDVFICENGGDPSFRELKALLRSPAGPCCEQGSGSPAPFQPSERLPEVFCAKIAQRPSTVWIARATHNLGYAGAVNALLDGLRSDP